MRTLRARRQQRADDAHTVAAHLTGKGEMYVAEIVNATGLTPRRVYRALSALRREGRVVARKADEGWPRRKVWQLATHTRRHC